ncbi:hypothetical protein BGZ63DRAFT_433164 [Mariannaea sp. PMI_226]|nr:hypothetical protein BGZ63DRAFT_433164 [Mariannaea sp. PMI_226]
MARGQVIGSIIPSTRVNTTGVKIDEIGFTGLDTKDEREQKERGMLKGYQQQVFSLGEKQAYNFHFSSYVLIIQPLMSINQSQFSIFVKLRNVVIQMESHRTDQLSQFPGANTSKPPDAELHPPRGARYTGLVTNINIFLLYILSVPLLTYHDEENITRLTRLGDNDAVDRFLRRFYGRFLYPSTSDAILVIIMYIPITIAVFYRFWLTPLLRWSVIWVSINSLGQCLFSLFGDSFEEGLRSVLLYVRHLAGLRGCSAMIREAKVPGPSRNSPCWSTLGQKWPDVLGWLVGLVVKIFKLALAQGLVSSAKVCLAYSGDVLIHLGICEPDHAQEITLTSLHSGPPLASRFYHFIFAAPSSEMAIVYNVLLSALKLNNV